MIREAWHEAGNPTTILGYPECTLAQGNRWLVSPPHDSIGAILTLAPSFGVPRNVRTQNLVPWVITSLPGGNYPERPEHRRWPPPPNGSRSNTGDASTAQQMVETRKGEVIEDGRVRINKANRSGPVEHLIYNLPRLSRSDEQFRPDRRRFFRLPARG